MGVPLALKGVAFGALCVVDQEARDWSTKDLETLQDLAQDVVTEIEFRILSARLEAAHETLSEQNGQLEQVIERQNEFLGMAAHDMRTPLTVAIGYSSVLAAKSSTLTTAHLKMAQTIGRSCQFMVRLIDDLLDLEALKSGKLSLSLQPTPTRDFLLQLLDTNRLLAAAKQTEIEVQADLHIDRHKFEQVLNNLLGNAIKYSPTSTCIQVSAHEQQGRLEIRVQDQGPGIAPAKRSGPGPGHRRSDCARTWPNHPGYQPARKRVLLCSIDAAGDLRRCNRRAGAGLCSGNFMVCGRCWFWGSPSASTDSALPKASPVCWC